MANNLDDGLNIKFGFDISELQEGVKEAKRSMRDLDKEFEVQTASMDDWRKSTDGINARLTTLSKKLDIQRGLISKWDKALQDAKDSGKASADEIHRLSDKLADAKIAYGKTERSINYYNKTLKELKEGTRDAEKATDALRKKNESLSKGYSVMKNVAANFATLIGTRLAGAIASGVKESINAFAEYEQAFTGVMKTVDGSRVEIETLSGSLQDLAGSVLPATATELANVAAAGGQLGIEVKDLKKFTETMVRLGVSTDITADNAGILISQFANIVGLSPESFSNFGSTLVELGNTLSTTESRILDMSMALASTFSAVKISSADILGFAGVLSSLGLEAQGGGSAMSAFVQSMQAAVETGEGLTEFANIAGKSAEEFADTFRNDATEAIIQFLQGLSDIRKKGGSAVVALDSLDIKERRQIDTLQRLIGKVELLPGAIENANEAWRDNIALTEESNKQFDTYDSKMAIFNNNVNSLKRFFGEQFAPVLVDTTTLLVNMFRIPESTAQVLSATFSKLEGDIKDFNDNALDEGLHHESLEAIVDGYENLNQQIADKEHQLKMAMGKGAKDKIQQDINLLKETQKEYINVLGRSVDLTGQEIGYIRIRNNELANGYVIARDENQAQQEKKEQEEEAARLQAEADAKAEAELKEKTRLEQEAAEKRRIEESRIASEKEAYDNEVKTRIEQQKQERTAAQIKELENEKDFEGALRVRLNIIDENQKAEEKRIDELYEDEAENLAKKQEAQAYYNELRVQAEIETEKQIRDEKAKIQEEADAVSTSKYSSYMTEKQKQEAQLNDLIAERTRLEGLEGKGSNAAENQQITDSIKLVQQEIDKLTGTGRTTGEKWGIAISEGLASIGETEFSKSFEGLAKGLQDLENTFGPSVKALMSGISDIFNTVNQAQVADVKARMEEMEKQFDAEMEMAKESEEEQAKLLDERLNAGEMTQFEYYMAVTKAEEEAAEEQKAIEDEKAKKEMELRAERAKYERQAFNADKANSIAQVWMEYAKAMMGTGKLGPVFGPIFGVALTGIAAAQTALIAKQEYVPAFAKGGIIDHPTVGLVGEAGKEAIMPLENNTEWIDDLAGRIAVRVQGGTTNSTMNDSHDREYNIHQEIYTKPMSRREIYLQTRRAMETR